MRMRSLVLTPLRLQNLHNNVHGAYQRLRSLVEAVSEISDHVDIYSLVPPEGRAPGLADLEAMEELRKSWGIDCTVVSGKYSVQAVKWPWFIEQMRWALSYRSSYLFNGFANSVNFKALKELLGFSPQLIVAHKLPSQELLRGLLPGDIPVIFDLDDIEHVAFSRQAELLDSRRDRLVAHAMVPSIRRSVCRAIRLSKHTLVCSEHDRSYLNASFDLDSDKLVVVPNACAIRPRAPCPPLPEMLFVGTFVWSPNVQAIEFFIANCWQRIRDLVPTAQLTVVGANPENVPSFYRHVEGVTFTGFVPDIEAVYRKAKVVICPILSGGGTRVKLVEAAAFGKPIVSTRLGAEGLDFEDGRNALLQDDVDGFVDACVRLLRDDVLCEQLGAAAHEHACAKFDRTVVVEQIRAVVQSCIN